MNPHAPFRRPDLYELGEFLARADRVVPMYDVYRGDTGPGTIGLRHDVDDNPGSLYTALRLAEWEFDQGFASTFYLLHGSYYWGEEMLIVAEQFEELGHEVGIHVNAIAEGLRQRRDPHVLLDEAITYLRSAVRVRGCVAHGDPLCGEKQGSRYHIRFVNDEIFSDTPRPRVGEATRTITVGTSSLRLAPIPRATFGLEYDANWLSRGDYLSDSGGKWSQPFDQVAGAYPDRGQLHMLVHPDWWAEAFTRVEVA